MKRIVTLALIMFLVASSGYCVGPKATAITLGGSTTIAISGTDTVYTDTYLLSYVDYMAIRYKASSSGVVNLKIEMEQDIEAPATENVSDTDMTEPDDLPDVDTALTDTNNHKKQFLPDTFKCYRFKITGLAGNDASTTLTIYVSNITGR